MKHKTIDNYENFEQEIDKKLKRKDKRKRPKMKVSGKSVLQLKQIVSSKK